MNKASKFLLKNIILKEVIVAKVVVSIAHMVMIRKPIALNKHTSLVSINL